jgi:hypothetical protein
MTGILKKSLAVLTAFSFLVSTMGIVLASHLCLASDHKSISLYANSGCCSESEDDCGTLSVVASEVSPICCVTEFSFHKIDASSTIPAKDVKNTTGFQSLAPSLLSWNNAPVDCIFVFSDHSPPPLPSGKIFLLSIHRLLV